MYTTTGLPWSQVVKNLPTMWETYVPSLGRGDPLEKGMATHSSILTWKIQWTEEPGALQSIGSRRVGHDYTTKHSAAWAPQVALVQTQET